MIFKTKSSKELSDRTQTIAKKYNEEIQLLYSAAEHMLKARGFVIFPALKEVLLIQVCTAFATGYMTKEEEDDLGKVENKKRKGVKN